MPDIAFTHPRLAQVYDAVNGERDDLDAYLRIATEVEAHHVLDLGCGTGALPLLLAATGRRVTAVDPAEASLRVARAKPAPGPITWLHGDATTLPPLAADLATMTGNTAQVFLTDETWAATLRGVHGALRAGGHLVFETRRPERRAWEGWNGRRVVDVPGVGSVEERMEVTEVALPLVSFRTTYTFASDGLTLRSDCTLRFRDRSEVEESLSANGFTVRDVRDAPNRPGREHLFLAQRNA